MADLHLELKPAEMERERRKNKNPTDAKKKIFGKKFRFSFAVPEARGGSEKQHV